jgi:peptidoglycan/xylan/chitin deacetylase (PgdA/CDA1 family)
VLDAQPGSILVLHDGNRGIICTGGITASQCDRSQEVGALALIVENLRRRGYRFVTVPELIQEDS